MSLEQTYKHWKPVIWQDDSIKYQRFIMVWKDLMEWRYYAMTQFIPKQVNWSPYA